MSGFIFLHLFLLFLNFTLLSWFHTESISDTDTVLLWTTIRGAQGRRSSATGCSSSVVLKFWSPWRLKRWHFLWYLSRLLKHETGPPQSKCRTNTTFVGRVSFKAHISLLRFIPCEFHGCYGYLWLLGVLGSST